MSSLVTPANGELVTAELIAQLTELLSGLRNIPVGLTGINDASNYALTVKNAGTGSRGAIIYAADGTTVLFQVDSGGVRASRTGAAAERVLTTGESGTITPVMLSLSPTSSQLGADVLLNNTGTYFDGPSMAQGTSGTWWASGTVTLQDTAGAAVFRVRLTDGTTVIADTVVESRAASAYTTATIAGYLANPAGNLRITVEDPTSTSGRIVANPTGADTRGSSIFGIRIG